MSATLPFIQQIPADFDAIRQLFTAPSQEGVGQKAAYAALRVTTAAATAFLTLKAAGIIVSVLGNITSFGIAAATLIISRDIFVMAQKIEAIQTGPQSSSEKAQNIWEVFKTDQARADAWFGLLWNNVIYLADLASQASNIAQIQMPKSR